MILRGKTFLNDYRSHMEMNPASSISSAHDMYVPSTKAVVWASILLWLGIALFNTGMFIFSFDDDGPVYEFFYGFRWTPLYHSLWLLIIPCILWFARKFPLNQKISLKHLSVHIALALGSAGLTSLYHTYFIYIRLGEPFEISSVSTNFLYYFDDRILLYIVVLTGYYAFDYYHKQNRESYRELELQEKINREKLNNYKNDIQPPFLLNTLKDIQNLVQHTPLLAEQLVADFAQIIRKLLHNSQKKTITLGDDLQFLKSYTSVLGTRLGRNIQFHESVQEADKTRHISVSLSVIKIMEQLLIRDRTSFSELDSFECKVFETEDHEGVKIQLDRLSHAQRMQDRHGTKNGTGDLRVAQIPGSNALTDLQYDKNGVLTISVTYPKNRL